MSVDTSKVPVTPDADRISWNIPNQLSAARIVMALLSFVTICFGWYLVSLVLFLIATATDWIDGYWARRHNQITQFGRILDPFADKVIICGTFILLGAIDGSLIAAWMAVVVTARELLVTALRSLIEGRSMDFSARWVGKWKMVLQCAAVAMSLWRLSTLGTGNPTSPVFDNVLVGVVLASLVATVYSGWGYLRLAVDMISKSNVGSANGE
jgi:CDP-diacylglycerol---glycerol-3-phosphate 3-phosphatidyltransferase